MPMAAPVRGLGDRGMKHAAAHAGRGGGVHRLGVFLVHADIADMREGEGDDLSGIGRVGQDFLVAGHRRVEADFAGRLADGAEAEAFQHRAVRQHEERGRARFGPAGLGGVSFGSGHVYVSVQAARAAKCGGGAAAIHSAGLEREP